LAFLKSLQAQVKLVAVYDIAKIDYVIVGTDIPKFLKFLLGPFYVYPLRRHDNHHIIFHQAAVIPPAM
jgi:hypothetical protein